MEMSNSLLIFAGTLLSVSHLRKLLRIADSFARSDFVAGLLKSIFLPFAGRVLAATDSGAPVNCTIADDESVVGGAAATGASPPTAATPTASATAETSPTSLRLIDPPGLAAPVRVRLATLRCREKRPRRTRTERARAL